MNRIGIMGGTFNPIHYGHLVVAEGVREGFGLDKVIFVPTGIPPHKDDDEIASAVHRYKMIDLAMATNPNFSLSDIEIRRPGKSYAKETIKEFKKIYKDTSLFFIIGADAIVEISTWKDIDELLKLCEFIAVPRPGYTFQIEERFRRYIHHLEVPALAISSTDIRRRIKEGRSIKYLVPQEVEEYINKHGLYQRSGDRR